MVIDKSMINEFPFCICETVADADFPKMVDRIHFTMKMRGLGKNAENP